MDEERSRLDNHKKNFFFIYLVMFIIGGWLLWSATHNRSKHENFSDNAKQTNNYKITKNYGLAFVDLALMPFTMRGCVRADKLQETKDESINEIADDKTLVNAALSADK